MSTEIRNLDFKNKNFIFLAILVIITICVRLYFLPSEIPFKTDAIGYFSFAFEISKTQEFPTGILATNDGWSLFLSPIFTMIGQSDMMNLINAQRITSILLSSLTIIPVFFLCKKIVSSKYALIGAGLFGFSHKLIENSLLGITEPLYIFLITFVLLFSLSKNSNHYFISFIFLGLAAIVRYESLFFIIPLSIIFFLRFKKQKTSFLKFPFLILIFILVLLPISSLRLESNDVDGFTSHTIFNPQILNPNTYSTVAEITDLKTETEKIQSSNSFISNSIFNILKFLGIISIPLFIFFIPSGIFNLFKTRNTDVLHLLIFGIFFIIPALYAYGREIQDARYLYVLFPIFCVISVYGLDITKKLERTKFVSLIISVIILSSILLLFYDQPDYTYDSEILHATQILLQDANGVNNYHGSSYVKIATLEKIWPNSLPLAENQRIDVLINKIPSQNFDSLEDFISDSKSSQLTHLLITENNHEAFLDDLLIDYEKYSYLEKIYDSKDHNYKNTIIILKIDYSIFEKILAE